MRANKFFNVTAQLCTTYMLVFSVSYLETGLKMAFLKSNAYIWARYFCYFIYLPYLAYLLGHSFTEMTWPVFRPGDVSDEECKALHIAYEVEIINFATAINYGPVGWAVGAFNT